GSVSAAVPEGLGTRTVATVFDFLTGGTASAASAPVVLAKGVAMTMFARKVMGLMVAATVGLVSSGVGLAGDGPPVAPPVPPTPVQPMPTPAVAAVPPALPVTPADAPRRTQEFDWRRDEAKTVKSVALAAQLLPAGERQVLVEALCIRVPAGFCERSGLAADDATGGPWILSQREARMLSALFRAEHLKEVIARPQLVMLDNQAGVVQTTQQVEVVTGLEAETKNGTTVYTPKVAKL